MHTEATMGPVPASQQPAAPATNPLDVLPASDPREVAKRRRDAERKLLRHLLYERDGRPVAPPDYSSSM
jgi:hypothetical protein